MKVNNEWKDYKLISTGSGMKIEKFDNIVLNRPDPQVIWESKKKQNVKLNGSYHRSNTGGGYWENITPIPDTFKIHWRDLVFELKIMNFKHVGIFPEQAVNWDRMMFRIEKANRPINVLNLFGYTGGATVACLKAGASVCHVDAAKSMCEMAKRNIQLSNCDITKARFIMDDCTKFVEREIKRGKKYDAIIMDPPSFGRGPKGEKWKIEDEIFNLVKLTKNIISDNPLFYLINSYTTGLQPTVMKNILDIVFNRGHVDADEIGIQGEDGIILPCGCSALLDF